MNKDRKKELVILIKKTLGDQYTSSADERKKIFISSLNNFFSIKGSKSITADEIYTVWKNTENIELGSTSNSPEKLCKNCSRKLNINDIFCSQCGEKSDIQINSLSKNHLTDVQDNEFENKPNLSDQDNNNQIKKPTYKSLSFSILVFILLTVIVVFISKLNNLNKSEAANSNQEQILDPLDEFKKNRIEILKNIRYAITNSQFENAVSISKKYIISEDKELVDLYNQSVNLYERQKVTDEIKTITEDLKKIPSTEYEKNYNLYKRLNELQPTNKKYIEKLKFYEIKYKELLAVEARKFQIKKQFHPWDGSHIKLERFIKEIMNDPDSYDHVKTLFWDKKDHLIVNTTFRGKNAFGGTVTNFIKAKVNLNGDIIEILDQW